MPDTRSLALVLSPAQLAGFCRQIRQRAPDPAQALQQLTAVQALLGLGNGNMQDPAYRQARQLLEEQLEDLRERLLAGHAERLGNALRALDSAAIAESFRALSRSGFGACAAHAWQQLEPEARDISRSWIDHWCRDAHGRATAASRYPDAPDFRAAGVDLDTYLALDELQRLLESG